MYRSRRAEGVGLVVLSFSCILCGGTSASDTVVKEDYMQTGLGPPQLEGDEDGCPLLLVRKFFNFTLFAGRWYRVAEWGTLLPNKTERCSVLQLTKVNGVNVYNYQEANENWIMPITSFILFSSRVNRISLLIPSEKIQMSQRVVAASPNFTSYAVLYGCINNSHNPKDGLLHVCDSKAVYRRQ